MTKAEIVEQIYEKVGFSKKESAELVERVFDIIKETLKEGEKVKISGFGNFVVREKNARKGRNPQTCLLYTSPSPRDRTRSRMPSSA